jgi:hypothetical protein
MLALRARRVACRSGQIWDASMPMAAAMRVSPFGQGLERAAAKVVADA